MKKALLFILLAPVVLVLLGLLLGLVWLVLTFAPAPVVTVALCVMCVAAIWFFYARGRSAGPASEHSFLGRPGSSDGLL